MSLLVAAEGGGQAAGSVPRTPRPMPLPDFRFLGCALHLPPAFSFFGGFGQMCGASCWPVLCFAKGCCSACILAPGACS